MHSRPYIPLVLEPYVRGPYTGSELVPLHLIRDHSQTCECESTVGPELTVVDYLILMPS